MKYYAISHSLSTKVVGKYPQSIDTISPDFRNDPNFVDMFLFQKAKTIPITPVAILEKRAKLTDLISAVSVGFTLKLLISDKLKLIFESVEHPGVQFFPCKIHFKGELISYWLMNVYGFDHELLDYSKSTFYLPTNSGRKLEEVRIGSVDEFENYKDVFKKDFPVKIERAYIKEEVNQELIFLKYSELGIFNCSETLKLKIENQNCTGINFMPLGLTRMESKQFQISD